MGVWRKPCAEKIKYLLRRPGEPDGVTHTGNPSIWEARWEDHHEFKLNLLYTVISRNNLSYIERSFLKK